MSGLFGTLSIGLQALMAQQAGLQITSQNIANANTPGYARERPDMVPSPPVQYGTLLFGNGVELQKIESVRDRILDLRVYQETSQQGQLQSFVTAAQQVEAEFNVSSGGQLQTALNGFFNSLSQLSANPSDLASRQSVIAAAQTLASAFQSTSDQTSRVQTGLDQGVLSTVDQINKITAQIANLNAQVEAASAGGGNAGPLEDARSQLIGQLSGLVDVSVIDAGSGSLTLTTANGAALVSSNVSFKLGTQADPATGLHRVVDSQGNDITTSIQGGQLGGQIQARDQFIPSVLSNLDDLAANVIQSFNTQHKLGFDLSGTAGGNFFVPFVQPSPGSNAGAAASFAVAISDPTKIAARGDGSAGDNGNVNALAGLQSQAIVNGQNPIDFYAGIVSQVGNQLSTANAELSAENLTLTQLQNQQASVSGVSLDEEATNLIRYQRAYEAAARVISVVDQLTQTAIALGNPGT